MEQQPTKQIIKFIAKNRLVKYAQFIELSSFFMFRLFIDNGFCSSLSYVFIGIFFALLAGESALLEHDLKKGDKNGR